MHQGNGRQQQMRQMQQAQQMKKPWIQATAPTPAAPAVWATVLSVNIAAKGRSKLSFNLANFVASLGSSRCILAI